MPIKKPPRNAGFLGGLLLRIRQEARRGCLRAYFAWDSEAVRRSGDTAVCALYSEM